MAHLDLQRGTYAAADTLLGTRDSRRIGHNTTLHRYSGPAASDAIAVRYHSTDILTLSRDGWLTLSTGGWHTVTTWQRINAVLPGPWRVSSRNGTPWLYYSGRPVTPYVDGLAVHPESGAVGMSGATLLTADDIGAIIDAADTATADREAKRAARLLREHPTAGGPRTHSRAAYDRRVYGCARCDVELSAEREARKAALHAEHLASHPIGSREAAGSHYRVEPVTTWPTRADGTTDYNAEPTRTERVRIECPWECPDRPRNW
jgi:hypothetical protein